MALRRAQDWLLPIKVPRPKGLMICADDRPAKSWGMPDRPQKITFAQMRTSGVPGLLIYCADYRCSHSIAISATHGLTMRGCPTSSRSSPAPRAASAGPTYRPRG